MFANQQHWQVTICNVNGFLCKNAFIGPDYSYEIIEKN